MYGLLFHVLKFCNSFKVQKKINPGELWHCSILFPEYSLCFIITASVDDNDNVLF